MKINQFRIILCFLFICLFILDMNAEISNSIKTDSIDMADSIDTTEDIRINPEIEVDSFIDDKKHPDYNFINLTKNKIIFNNANWDEFYDKLSKSSSNTISILHIGDSHLQADIATGKTRMLLQEKYGNAGRGIIIPFKLAKTNEPFDYSIKCSGSYSYSSLMKRPWQTKLKLTGASISPSSEKFNLTISTNSKNTPIQEFKTLRIHVDGDLYIDDVKVNNKTLELDEDYFIEESQPDHTDIIFKNPHTSAQLSLSSSGRLTIFGVSLLTNTNGVIYNVIGNNGAAYDSYNRMGDMGQDCSIFNPDLIIISLGTNEAFGSISDENFYNSIAKFVDDMRNFNENACILLTTPMECQKNGRINSNIKRLRDVIIQYAATNNIAVYDFYEIAGGYGASQKWYSNKLMGGDKIHNTSKGYNLHGTLLYDALINPNKEY